MQEGRGAEEGSRRSGSCAGGQGQGPPNLKSREEGAQSLRACSAQPASTTPRGPLAASGRRLRKSGRPCAPAVRSCTAPAWWLQPADPVPPTRAPHLCPPLVPPLPLAQRYRYRLVVDESLSVGVLGKHGRGAAEEAGYAPEDVEIVGGSMSELCPWAGRCVLVFSI